MEVHQNFLTVTGVFMSENATYRQMWIGKKQVLVLVCAK